jgi:hypothetical protein
VLVRHTNDSDIVPGGLEFPESNIDGDTTLALSLELVQHPCVLEGAFAQLGSFLHPLSVSRSQMKIKLYEGVEGWELIAE